MRLYFDDETIGMDRKVINASKHVYGSVCFCCCCCCFLPFMEPDIILV